MSGGNISVKTFITTSENSPKKLVLQFDASLLNQEGIKQTVAETINQMAPVIKKVESLPNGNILMISLDTSTLKVCLFEDNNVEATCKIIDAEIKIIPTSNLSNKKATVHDPNSNLSTNLKNTIEQATEYVLSLD